MFNKRMKPWCAILLLALSATTGSATAQTVCDKKCSKVLGLVNTERTKRGLGTVCINKKLMKAAEKHNKYQVAMDVMSHTGSGGSDIGERIKAEAYDFKNVAENVAVGMSSAKNVMHGWMNSPGHKKNILSDSVHMGIAFSEHGNYWTQVFGTPQRTGGGCNVQPVGGDLGILYKRSNEGPACTGLCEKMMNHINKKRNSRGHASMCVSPKLMAAAKEVSDKGYIKRHQNSKVEDAIADTGYSFQTYAISSLSVWSTGKIDDKMVLDLFKQNLPKQYSTWMGDFSQVGIASDSTKENWIMVLAATWDGESDKCDDGRAPRSTKAPEGLIADGDIHGIAAKNKANGRFSQPSSSLPLEGSSGSKSRSRSKRSRRRKRSSRRNRKGM